MISAFLTLAPLKKFLDIAVVLAVIAGALWVYLALVHRAEAITALTAANAGLATAANDSARTAELAKAAEARSVVALNEANKRAEANAAQAGKLKERIANAPKHGCLGPAERALLDGLRADQPSRRSQVPQPVSP